MDGGLFKFKDMRRQQGICVEIDSIFYESLRLAGRAMNHDKETIKKRCLSDKFANYKIITINPNEKRCSRCFKVKLKKEFRNNSASIDGLSFLCKECEAKYREPLKKHKSEYDKIYRKAHKKERNAYFRKYEMERRATDTSFRLNGSMRSGILKSLKSGKNGAHWETLVDYDLKKLMIHLESKFTEGMSWDNYGYGKYKWNVDHVIARSKFNIVSAECKEFENCWALKNLQPLWQTRNKEKGNSPMEPKYLIKPF